MSKDGQVMETIGTIAGNGNPTEPQFYQFNTSLGEPGFYLFRLIQQDFDGNRSYSPLIEVQFEQDVLVISPLEPNPASDQVFVKFHAGLSTSARLTLHPMNGKILDAYHIAPNNRFEYRQAISTKKFPAGIYFISVQTGDAIRNKLLVISE